MPTPPATWRKQNPERARELQQKANANFRERKRRLRELLLEPATTTEQEADR